MPPARPAGNKALFIIVPQFGNPSPDELAAADEDRQDFLTYLDRSRSKHGLATSAHNQYLLRAGKTIRLGGDLQLRLPKSVGKGTAVRLALFSLLWSLDTLHGGPTARNSAWIVMIDGTGAFPAGEIDQIIRGLKRWPVVFGCRKQAWTDDQSRVQIEAFETYLLKHRFPRANLPDCQAGIWGVRAWVLDSLPLTATGYGLEWDLVSSALEAGVRFGFVPVKVIKRTAPSDSIAGRPAPPPKTPSRGQSTFQVEDSISKLKFIIQKLGLTEQEFSRLLSQYHRRLPDEYRREAANLPVTTTHFPTGERRRWFS